MRIRKVSTNCSNSISFEDFESDILDCEEVIFTNNYERFCIIGMPGGEILEEFDVFWESESERVSFISFVEELGY